MWRLYLPTANWLPAFGKVRKGRKSVAAEGREGSVWGLRWRLFWGVSSLGLVFVLCFFIFCRWSDAILFFLSVRLLFWSSSCSFLFFLFIFSSGLVS